MTNTITNTEIQVWVGDLHEYTCGMLTGDWFALPMDLEDILMRVLTNGEHEYFVADIDSSIKGLDNLSLIQLNEIAEKLESLSEYEKEAFVMVLNSADSMEEGLEMFENEEYRIFHDCENMSQVAMYWYEETGLLSQMYEAFDIYVKSLYDLPNIAKEFIKEELTNIPKFYIDYELVGDDMEINRNFHKVNKNTYIELFR